MEKDRTKKIIVITVSVVVFFVLAIKFIKYDSASKGYVSTKYEESKNGIEAAVDSAAAVMDSVGSSTDTHSDEELFVYDGLNTYFDENEISKRNIKDNVTKILSGSAFVRSLINAEYKCVSTTYRTGYFDCTEVIFDSQLIKLRSLLKDSTLTIKERNTLLDKYTNFAKTFNGFIGATKEITIENNKKRRQNKFLELKQKQESEIKTTYEDFTNTLLKIDKAKSNVTHLLFDNELNPTFRLSNNIAMIEPIILLRLFFPQEQEEKPKEENEITDIAVDAAKALFNFSEIMPKLFDQVRQFAENQIKYNKEERKKLATDLDKYKLPLPSKLFK